MNTAILATLPDHSARAYRLTIDGVDFLNPARTDGFGIDKTSIRLTEAGPPNVSSLSFTINDPNIATVFEEAATIEFWDIARDRALFLGFMQSFSIRPTAVGRTIDIDCIGIEALLDWMMVPAFTVPTGTGLAQAVQMCVSNATGIGWRIDAAIGSSSPRGPGVPVLPLGGGYYTTYDVVLDGKSLREAITAVIVAAAAVSLLEPSIIDGAATVDFYSSLQFVTRYVAGNANLTDTPSGYTATLAIDDSVSGTIAAHGLDFAANAAGVPHSVYITGGTAAGTGLVSDGSGIVGAVATLSDSTILTNAQMTTKGLSYLSQFSTSTRGSLTLDPVPASVLSLNYRPMSHVQFAVDSQVFGEVSAYDITSIDKTFADLREGWVIHFGGDEPSAIRQLRRLTRDTRS